MSLDVSLHEPFPVPRDACLLCTVDDEEHVHRGDCLFAQNITHNLNEMADVAGIYKVLWRPDELFDEPRARDIVDALQQGYDKLKADPERFIPFEPENKWGTYWSFLPWLERYITACREHPDAVVLVSR
jgi:hypothetical protein